MSNGIPKFTGTKTEMNKSYHLITPIKHQRSIKLPKSQTSDFTSIIYNNDFDDANVKINNIDDIDAYSKNNNCI